jgi:hypothetical protein
MQVILVSISTSSGPLVKVSNAGDLLNYPILTAKDFAELYPRRLAEEFATAARGQLVLFSQ